MILIIAKIALFRAILWYNLLMDNIENKIGEIGKYANLNNLAIPEAVVMLGLGAAVLLFGYRIKKIAFFIIWFILGFNLMTWLMPTINNVVPEIATSELYQILLPIGGGLVLALLGFTIEKICVGGICFALVMMVTVQYFGTEVQTLAIGGVAGVIAAALAVNLMKPATIIATAVAGAYALTLAILMLNPSIDFGTFYWPMILGIAVVGAIFQFMTTKRVR